MWSVKAVEEKLQGKKVIRIWREREREGENGGRERERGHERWGKQKNHGSAK